MTDKNTYLSSGSGLDTWLTAPEPIESTETSGSTYLIAFSKPAGHREVAPREFDVHSRWKPAREAEEKRRRKKKKNKNNKKGRRRQSRKTEAVCVASAGCNML